VPTGKKKGKGQKGGPGSKKKNSKSKNALQKKSGKKGTVPNVGNDLMSKLFEMMERHKEVRVGY